MTAKKKDEAQGNMSIWDAVSKTDVDHTKEVSFGRKFTAIDAHSQIMEATRLFGPVGEGWGYDNEYGETHLQDGRIIAWCDVRFWWVRTGEWEGIRTHDPKRHFGPVRGGAILQALNKDGSFKQPDTDAYKKASTDGLTKLISHLGFNADVFLGMFDDNKYVQGLQKEKQAEATDSEKEYQETRSGFIKKIQSCKDSSQIDGVMADYKLWVDRLVPSVAVEIRAWVDKQRAEVKSGSK
jgi:hypothetical protein